MCSHVFKILNVFTYDQGCTLPATVQLDDTRKAILKYPRNPMGIIVLFNEYITYCIANAIQLTIPNFGFAIVDSRTQLSDNLGRGLENFMGTGFFCEYIPKTAPASPKILKYVSNLNEAGRIILLDQIVKNSDRYAANMLIEVASAIPKMYAIDHSHALGDPDWSASTLVLRDYGSPYVWRENEKLYNMLIAAGAVVTAETLATDSTMIQDRITKTFLEDIFANILVDWVEEIGVENITHAREYVLDRVHNLDAICQTINEERGV